MVTKQQQLEWLAKNCESWPVMSEFIVMHSTNIGICGSCWEITLEEWQQERDKMQKKAERVAQPAPDNSWHDRGEFPPAGTICEMIDDKNTWLECEVISHKDGSCIGWIPSRKSPFYTYDKSEFRQIRTEREKAIDAACDVICKNGVHDFERGVITKLYDAGMLK